MLVDEYSQGASVLIIPVIDLMDGHVVHARRVDRSNYRPLQSKLTPSSQPGEVVQALLDLAPFPAIYAADLDAILHRGDHAKLLRTLIDRFPSLSIWVDAGFGKPRDIEFYRHTERIAPVIGSESLASSDALRALLELAPQAILSLDTRDDVPLGPSELFSQPQLWPRHVIVMTLDRVGSGSGPAFARLRETAALAHDRRLIAAGGVRSVADLKVLQAMNVYAVLIASAIHDGTLDRTALERFLIRSGGEL